MKNELVKYAKENSWQAGMDKSKGLDGWDNYSGDMDKPDWVVSVGRNRDSDLMAESNFDTALEMLGGAGKNVVVERFGHWACGWFELILVNPKSEKHVRIAKEIRDSLADYPLLDESDYSNRESEYQGTYAEGAKNDLAEALAKHFGLKVSNQLRKIAYELNIECQNYYGNDSCIDVYASRAPDKRDIEQLKKCMDQVHWDKGDKLAKTFDKLVKAVDAYKVEE